MPSLALLAFALVGMAAGFLAADLVSGLVHWACDTYFQRTTWLIGARLIAPFREHHVDPDSIGAHGWLERSGSNCLAAAPVLALALTFTPALSGPAHPWRLGCAAFVGALGVTVGFTNEIHAWAHAESAPRLVRFLQRCGVLLAPERHARHHAGSSRTSYAIVSGWSNAWLDAVLPRIEATLARLGIASAQEAAER